MPEPTTTMLSSTGETSPVMTAGGVVTRGLFTPGMSGTLGRPPVASRMA